MNENNESSVGGVSVRAMLAFMLVFTVCLVSGFQAWAAYRSGQDITIGEPLYSATLVALGFFFGQKAGTLPGSSTLTGDVNATFTKTAVTTETTATKP